MFKNTKELLFMFLVNGKLQNFINFGKNTNWISLCEVIYEDIGI